MFKKFLLGLTALTMILGCVGCGNSGKTADGGNAKGENTAKNNYQVITTNIANSTDTSVLAVPLMFSVTRNTPDGEKAVLLKFKGDNISKDFSIVKDMFGNEKFGNDNVQIEEYKEGTGATGSEWEGYYSNSDAKITFTKLYDFNMMAFLIPEEQYGKYFEEYKTKQGELLKQEDTVGNYTFYMSYDKDGKEKEYFALYGDKESNTYFYFGKPSGDEASKTTNKSFHDYITKEGNITYNELEVDKSTSMWCDKKFYKLTDADKKYPIIHDCIAAALRNAGIQINESSDIYWLTQYADSVKCLKTYNNKSMYYTIKMLDERDWESEPKYYQKQHEENGVLKANEENSVYEVVANKDSYNDYFLKTKTGRVFEYNYGCEAEVFPDFKDANFINEKITGVPFVEGNRK